MIRKHNHFLCSFFYLYIQEHCVLKLNSCTRTPRKRYSSFLQVTSNTTKRTELVLIRLRSSLENTYDTSNIFRYVRLIFKYFFFKFNQGICVDLLAEIRLWFGSERNFIILCFFFSFQTHTYTQLVTHLDNASKKNTTILKFPKRHDLFQS